jgi:hypothetical protein
MQCREVLPATLKFNTQLAPRIPITPAKRPHLRQGLTPQLLVYETLMEDVLYLVEVMGFIRGMMRVPDTPN